MYYIFIADIHTMVTTPLCRTDDFLAAQIRKYKELRQFVELYDAKLICGGDIVHKDSLKSQTEIIGTLNLIHKHLMDMDGIAGNHDLIYRNIENIDFSIISNLINTDKYRMIANDAPLAVGDDLIYGFSYGSKITAPKKKGKNKTIAVFHGLVTQESTTLFSSVVAKDLLRDFPDYDIILTGDNHKTFTETYEGRTLINPGSLMRFTADQEEHKPCVFLYNSDTGIYKPLYFTIEQGVIDRSHIDKKQEKDDRLESLVEMVNTDFESGSSYSAIMDRYIEQNDISPKVLKEMYEAVDKRGK